jgi:hypothetical protein
MGDSIQLHILLNNESEHAIHLVAGTDPYNVEVLQPNNDKALMTSWGRQLRWEFVFSEAQMNELPAGSVTEVGNITSLSRAFDMTVEGKYTIRAHWKVPSVLDRGAWIDLWSRPLVITLEEAPDTQPTPSKPYDKEQAATTQPTN